MEELQPHIDEAEKSNLMFGFGKDWNTDPVEVGSKDQIQLNGIK
jgi:hypothetical protein